MQQRAIAAIAALLGCGGTALLLTQSAAGVTAAHEYNHVLQVVLSGRGGGDADGFGSFSATISGRQLCYGLQVVGVTPAAAHIHKGAAGTDGPVVVTLKAGRATAGCTTLSRSLASALVSRPGGYYVNVHTADFPSGAVRGQLRHPPRP